MKRNIHKALFWLAILVSSLAMAADSVPSPRTAVFPIQSNVNVFLIGPGLVGNAFLSQITKNHEILNERYGVNVKIIGIANSRTMHFNAEGIRLEDCHLLLEQSKEVMSLNKFLNRMISLHLANSVFVDCTSNQAIADSYLSILSSGISVVTPNKKANSGSLENYKKLQAESKSAGALFLYDSNVGAGLPIISTIKSLIMSGDQIVKIEAILSGTLSYLMNSFEEGVLFSELVLEAQRRGYTEPDPRDDLNGMDVARKLLILARETGSEIEMKDIDLQRFLPDEMFAESTVEGFYKKLKEYDPSFTNIRREVESQNKKLRYIASFEHGKALISLQSVGPEHPFYNLSGNDNIIAITTKYYSKNPVVIRGPGAGADVTAAKVLEGVVRVGLKPNYTSRAAHPLYSFKKKISNDTTRK